ncbi:MAG: ribosome silencing factor [Wenzhouxiangellaceae bacterium]|jgi:ribosome-associated protein|nr:ribosome silencing factor [Wenzhouxiangellaceae bacterium]MBS3745583.1 ribosome silencing factor [Wenzhouxiangellaceae bacterium]MBS3822930.1 ribosome silencing factor [Wenzhouxiangellaceae bacterium]
MTDTTTGQAGEKDPCDLRDLVVGVLDDAKAQDIESFDLRDRNTFADFMIVASGTSSRQNKAMADRLTMKIKEQGLPAPLGVEGQQDGEWVLVDLTDVVVHLMLPQTRAFYNLEKLWDETTRSRPARLS